MASIRMKRNKNGSIAYVVRVYAGKGADGKTRYLSRTYTPAPLTSPNKISQTLNVLCAELQQKAKDPGKDGSIRFSDYAQHFLQRKSLTVSAYTLQSYRLTLQKACEYLGGVPLERIRAQRIGRESVLGRFPERRAEKEPGLLFRGLRP